MTPPFRSALWKSLTLTIALLGLAWIGLHKLIVGFAVGAPGWMEPMISLATGVGLLFFLAYLIPPVSFLVAGFYLDELSERAEAELGCVGRAPKTGAALWLGAKFAVLSLAVNAFALLVFLMPGINVTVFLAANAYLFGREYFEFVAIRFRSAAEADALRQRHALYLFVSGAPIALLVATPILNLLTPLFAIAYMARIHHRLVPPIRLADQPAS